LKQLLWYLLAGTRGGLNRIRIIEALLDRPYNAHQLSEELELDYRTMRHHLDVLTKNHVLARPEGKAYGSMYFVSGGLEEYMDVFEKIKGSVVGDSGKILANSNKKANG
jgi:DNA-binding transcriptional ArsR family regulator